MENVVIKKMLQDFYHETAFTRDYIMGFIVNHVVYMTVCDSHMVDCVTCIDKASRGQGYALRFKPNRNQKMLLLANGATALCSESFFDSLVSNSKYNRGEIFEKLVTEYAGLEWTKDNIPYTMAGDIHWNGKDYQIKFEKATFTNEKTMASLRK